MGVCRVCVLGVTVLIQRVVIVDVKRIFLVSNEEACISLEEV